MPTIAEWKAIREKATKDDVLDSMINKPWCYCSDDTAMLAFQVKSQKVCIDSLIEECERLQAELKHCEHLCSEACGQLAQFRPSQAQQLIVRIRRAANDLLTPNTGSAGE